MVALFLKYLSYFLMAFSFCFENTTLLQRLEKFNRCSKTFLNERSSTSNRGRVYESKIKNYLLDGREACRSLLLGSFLVKRDGLQTFIKIRDERAFSNLKKIFINSFDRKTLPDDNLKKGNIEVYDLDEIGKLFTINAILEEPFGDLFQEEHQLVSSPEGSVLIRSVGKEFYLSEDGREYNVFNHFGGGVLGHPIYLLKNLVIENDREQSLLFSTRVYPNSIFKDFFCKELPVATIEDARRFISKTGPEFKTSAACMKCHLTMDPITNMMGHLLEKDLKLDKNKVVTVVTRAPASKNSEAFHNAKMPSRLRYRNNKGEFVDIYASDLSAFGKVLSEQFDVYSCFTEKISTLLDSSKNQRRLVDTFYNEKKLLNLIVELI